MATPETTFIYPAHELFEPYREFVESTELHTAYDGEQTNSWHGGGGRTIIVEYHKCPVPFNHNDPREPPAKSDEFMIDGKRHSWFWFNGGGINTTSHAKRWPDGYVNQGFRVANDHGGGTTPQANEMLTWGVGTLRPFRVHGAGMSTFLCQTVQRVGSALAKQQGLYIVDTDVSVKMPDGEYEWQPAPYPLESTNLIMPEVIGELRQLVARRGEQGFLTAYLRDLKETVRPVDPYDGSEHVPFSLAVIKPRWRAAHLGHLATGLWDTPPDDTSELIDRAEELLGRTTTDPCPTEKVATPKPSSEYLSLLAKYNGML